MAGYLTSGQAAKRLGLPVTTLSTYITVGKLTKPKSITTGQMTIYLWTEDEIERARKLLPKIKNGRKTRYQKQESVARSQKLVKPKSKTKKKK